ncbi:anaerobic coproporphyrinogen III oxidase [Aureibacillus halotolerans]|uniref:Anaerobic coproporphyrinogen III oxidase n=2 Tax=Aureibacillus halotolerans TaxID=1508390 RepID=A0A4R6TR05_9BACI|nr:anaerobic coproporphyrinogen III oxidase [Aureibacillus halotolerans]
MIRITGASERLHPSIRRIADLFFETTTICSDEADADMEVVIQQEGTKLTVTLITAEKTLIEERTVAPDEEDLVKRAINEGLLATLEKLTDRTQPWGFLTGIRPTKLFHNQLREGANSEAIETQLQSTYKIQPDKTRLMNRITKRQQASLPDLYALKQEVSLYIGIPYCPTKCAYCTFPAYAIRRASGQVSGFLKALEEEIEAIGEWLSKNDVRVTTIYFGGGTPTSITAEEMDHLYEHLYATVPDVANVRELTVEAGRPDTITPEKIDVMKKWNVDRISINPQSYIQNTLDAIGRHHSVEETIEKYWLAKDMGLDNINMDLIIGLPGETTKEFLYTLEETRKLMPTSLTVHTLSFKRASKMTKNRDRYKVADRDEVVRMMEAAEHWMGQHDYLPYYVYRQKNILGNLENTGYAKAGFESLYNIMIMEEMQTIIGIGCGAASKFVDPATGKIQRFANPKDPASYMLSYRDSIKKKLHMLDEIFNDQTNENKVI